MPASESSNKGRFVRGNRGGPGDPWIAARNRWRQRFLEAVTDGAVQECAAALIAAAKTGNPYAIKLFFELVLPRDPIRLEGDIRHVHLDLNDARQLVEEARKLGLDDHIPAALLESGAAAP